MYPQARLCRQRFNLPPKPRPNIFLVDWLIFCLFTWAFESKLSVALGAGKKGKVGGKTTEKGPREKKI